MADKIVIQTGENSPEQVAYKLMDRIFDAEGRGRHGNGKNPVSRKEILQTYRQCLAAVNDSDPKE